MFFFELVSSSISAPRGKKKLTDAPFGNKMDKNDVMSSCDQTQRFIAGSLESANC